MWRTALPHLQRRCPRRLAGANGPDPDPPTEYLQLVFTLPDKLSELFLAGPAVTYNLLMQIAWRELKKLLEGLGIQASALIVLHTWNQHLVLTFTFMF